MIMQRVIDVVYREKFRLTDIARMISTQVTVDKKGVIGPYIGTTWIDDLVPVIGLKVGIERFRKHLMNRT